VKPVLFTGGFGQMDARHRKKAEPQVNNQNNHFAEMCCGTEAGSYLRLIDLCITQL